MNVTFYFDPSCRWTWIASRWLTVAAVERDIDITWRFYSLTLKRDKLDLNDVHPAHQMLRVLAAVAADHDTAMVGRLYTAFGSRWHLGEAYSAAVIPPALADVGLDAAYAAAATDEAWDKDLRQSLEAATATAGEDVGSPILELETPEGPRGYFGPILTRLPDTEACLRLWDGIQQLASVPDFYEFKRSRSTGPDVGTTKAVVSG